VRPGVFVEEEINGGQPPAAKNETWKYVDLMRTRPLATLWGLFGLLLLGCGKPSSYKIERVGWNNPVFLDSGQIGVVLWRWTEVGEPCAYGGFIWSTCEHQENLRAAVISFSPASGKVDTFFEPRVNPSGYMVYSFNFHHPHIIYADSSGDSLHFLNIHTKAHRSMARHGRFGHSGLSRSGRFFVRGDSLMDFETGEVTPLALPSGLWLSYYDDLAQTAYVSSHGSGEPLGKYGLIYDFKSGTLDSSKMRRCKYSNYCVPYLLGSTFMIGPFEPAPTTRRWTVMVARLDTLVVGLSHPAPLDITVPVWKSIGKIAYHNIEEIDLDRGLMLYDDHPLQGFSITDLNGVGKTYRAQDYVPVSVDP